MSADEPIDRVKLLVEKDKQIGILQDLLKASIRPADLELARDVQRHEHALFGVTGRNGISSDLAAVKQDIEGLDRKFDEMRDKEFTEIRASLLDAKTQAEVRSRFFWKVVAAVAPLLVAIIGVIYLILAVTHHT